ncbi:Lrp/AsnC family transcriptional regulator [Mycolicibacterium sp.]|uniref:Lrp/AsnC family transcriptional regulator n=1 Tax=Mycolicibacterium sp. TaxID=2320850 RepID=UPI003D0BE049
MALRPDGAAALDQIDRRLIHELALDGRISMRALAEKAHVSRAHAYVRVERLRSAGIIEGFTVRINHERAGLGASAFVALSIRQDAWRGVAIRLRNLPFVEDFWLVGGDYDVLVLVRAPDNAGLRDLILERLQDLQGVQSTRTWLIFDEAAGPGPAWVENAEPDR